MHFNLYLDDSLAKELDKTAKRLGASRSGLIRQAVREWLDKGRLGAPTWPQAVLEWRGVEDFPPFEDSRRELRAPPERPLG
jgi:predicted transcriptional regulator